MSGNERLDLEMDMNDIDYHHVKTPDNIDFEGMESFWDSLNLNPRDETVFENFDSFEKTEEDLGLPSHENLPDKVVLPDTPILPHSSDPRLSDCLVENSLFINGQPQTSLENSSDSTKHSSIPSVTEKLRSKIITKYEIEGRDISVLYLATSVHEEKLTEYEMTRRKEKQERNKISARKSRERKREELELLRKRHDNLLRENSETKSAIWALRQKVVLFEDTLNSHTCFQDTMLPQQETETPQEELFLIKDNYIVDKSSPQNMSFNEMPSVDDNIEWLLQENFSNSDPETNTAVVTSKTRYGSATAPIFLGFNVGVQENTGSQDPQACEQHERSNNNLSNASSFVSDQPDINIAGRKYVINDTMENNVASSTPWTVEAAQNLQKEKDERMELIREFMLE